RFTQAERCRGYKAVTTLPRHHGQELLSVGVQHLSSDPWIEVLPFAGAFSVYRARESRLFVSVKPPIRRAPARIFNCTRATGGIMKRLGSAWIRVVVNTRDRLMSLAPRSLGTLMCAFILAAALVCAPASAATFTLSGVVKNEAGQGIANVD